VRIDCHAGEPMRVGRTGKIPRIMIGAAAAPGTVDA